ncbi:MAG: ketoacyl-ACP synthase III [Desulfovibrionaceae bacterium]|nr:ketoacyl-ACP synthase III [Desulfovibrionaceae bacterium]
MKAQCIIRGLGLKVPKKVVSNADLEKLVETSDEWIVTRTGIRTRCVANAEETCSELALAAAGQALDQAGMAAEDLTHIVVGTFSADYVIPSAACVLEHKLGLKNRVALDVSAACSGFLYSVEVARGLIALHPESRVLVCASEILTSRTNWEDRSTCVLFGDGAGAAVLTADAPGLAGGRIIDLLLASDGSLGDLLSVKGGGSAAPYRLGDRVGEEFFAQMMGREVYKHAVRNMTAISQDLLARNGVHKDDLDVLLPHQANLRIIEAVGRKLDIPPEKVFVNVDRYGNTSAASVPLALTEARQTGFIKDGDLVLVTTFGGGFTWGAALIRF